MITINEFEKINIPQNPISGFEFFEGNKVLLSTPHAVSQTRNNTLKVAESETYKLAKIIADNTGCSLLTKTENLNDDANLEINNNYRNKIAGRIEQGKIKYIFDIHSLNSSRSQDINFGTNYGFNLVGNTTLFTRIKDVFKQHNFNPSTDFPFAASEKTITGFFSKHYHIFCLQIEVNSSIYKNEKQLNNLIDCLTQVVKITLASDKINS